MSPPAKRAAKRGSARAASGSGSAVSAEEEDPIAVQEPRRQRSFYLPDSLIARVRNAVGWTNQYPEEATSMAEFTERALRSAVAELEGRRNKGKPFPEVGRLPRGPAPGAAAKRGAALRESRKRQRDED
jgi:hypothetical protein